MGRLLRDGLEFERYLGIKRWERKSHKIIWKRRKIEEEASPFSFSWKENSESLPGLRYAHLLAMYLGDFALVRYVGEINEADSGLYLLRAGIPWKSFLPALLQRYLQGVPVPVIFQPTRRIPSDWITQILTWPLHGQLEWIAVLRDKGLLPKLPKLDSEGVAPWIRWEEVRSRFLDFNPAKTPLKGSLPLG